MLVLSRKQGERLYIGEDIRISVLEVHGRRVRVGIEAPKDVRVVRAELCVWDDSQVGEHGDRHAVLAGS